jgi:SM-20-related protein
MNGIVPTVALAQSQAYPDAAFGDLIVNIDRLRAATLSTDPFDFLYVPGTIDNEELAEIDAFRAPFEDKFGIDLSPYPLHITVRGHVRGKDGAIHTDSKDKVLTGLLYLNLDWNETGGRLRLLRDGKNINAYALEIPPVAGNMVVFRRSDRSWHGHLPSKSRRLALQFNWVSGDAYVRRELARHRFSGWMKRLSGAAARV